MAARLSLDERVFVESSLGAGRNVARRLGRDPSTVHRELARCTGRAGYDVRAAHAWACARALRVRGSKLADDPVLAAAVNERLRLRWSPQAAAADLRGAGMSVCAETVYRACYANDARSGLPAGAWAKLPRRARRRRPRCVAQAHKPSPLGEYGRLADRPADVEDRMEPGHWEGDLIVGKANLTAAVTLAERTSRYTVTAALPDGYSAGRRRRGHRGAGPPARSARAHPHLGPRPRDGPLGRRRGRARHRGVLLRAALAVAAAHQRAHQRSAAPMAPQRHQPRHRTTAPRGHRGQPQHDAPPTPQLGISTRHLHSANLQPPIELALFLIEGIQIRESIEEPIELAPGIGLFGLSSQSSDLPDILPVRGGTSPDPDRFAGKAVLSIRTKVRPRFLRPSVAGGHRAHQGDELQQEEALLQGEPVDLHDLLRSLALCSMSRTYRSVEWCHVDPDDPCSIRQYGPLRRWSDEIDLPPPVVSEAQLAEVLDLYRDLQGFESNHVETLRISLDRWNRSLREKRLEDQIIDLAIAFECMYLHDNDGELTYRLALRVAHHLGASLQEREKYRDGIRDFYKARSGVVHRGSVAAKNQQQFTSLAASVSEVQKWFRKGVGRIIADGCIPDWEKLIVA